MEQPKVKSNYASFFSPKYRNHAYFKALVAQLRKEFLPGIRQSFEEDKEITDNFSKKEIDEAVENTFITFIKTLEENGKIDEMLNTMLQQKLAKSRADQNNSPTQQSSYK